MSAKSSIEIIQEGTQTSLGLIQQNTQTIKRTIDTLTNEVMFYNH